MLKNRITNITPAKKEQKAILKESLLHHFADFSKDWLTTHLFSLGRGTLQKENV